MVHNHPSIATPMNNFCPKTLSNLARDKKVFKGFIRPHRTENIVVVKKYQLCLKIHWWPDTCVTIYIEIPVT